ncbi:hypothetical protein [Streptomyces venetus]|uniref:hypothetical protein n=1 Tax=Streptomyces venetus TaxID=1701086 RepID=UPI003C306578
MTRRRNEIQAVETGVRLLLSAGFEPSRAARLYLAFIDTVLSRAAADAAFEALPRERREADHRAWRNVYQGLDPDTYPALTAVRSELPAMADSSFKEAVDLRLEALAARAPRSAERPRSTPTASPARVIGTLDRGTRGSPPVITGHTMTRRRTRDRTAAPRRAAPDPGVSLPGPAAPGLDRPHGPAPGPR